MEKQKYFALIDCSSDSLYPSTEIGTRGERKREMVKQIYSRLSVLPRVLPECSEPPIRSYDRAESWANGFHPGFFFVFF